VLYIVCASVCEWYTGDSAKDLLVLDVIGIVA